MITNNSEHVSPIGPLVSTDDGTRKIVAQPVRQGMLDGVRVYVGRKDLPQGIAGYGASGRSSIMPGRERRA